MQYTQQKIEGIDFKDTEKVFESFKGHIVVTKQNGSIDIYQKQQDQFQNIKTYQHHQGQIMDVAFTPLKFIPYLVTVSYDRSLNVYNLEILQNESVFRYQEDDSQVGYFSHVCFCSDNRQQLRFLVGTSNGYILDFNSDLNFNPSKHKIFDNSITSMDVSQNGQVVVSSVGCKSKLFTTFSFQTFIEFGQVINEKNKINHLKFNQFNMEKSYDELIMVVDNSKVFVWKCDKNQMEILKLQEWDLDQKCLDVQWQLGGFSANLILFNKNFQQLNLMRLTKSYDQDTLWNLDNIMEE